MSKPTGLQSPHNEQIGKALIMEEDLEIIYDF